MSLPKINSRNYFNGQYTSNPIEEYVIGNILAHVRKQSWGESWLKFAKVGAKVAKGGAKVC